VSKSIRQQLEHLKGIGQLRQLRAFERDEQGRLLKELDSESASSPSPQLLNFSSNDYLGLSRHPSVLAAAEEALLAEGAGSTSSRLVTGHSPLAAELEHRLATWLGHERALLFGTGFMTNIGVISALMGRNDEIVIDRLAHASLIDGSQLSGAKISRYKHNDLEDLEACLAKRSDKGRTLIVTESIFSMDGDLAPLGSILVTLPGAWFTALDCLQHRLPLLCKRSP